MELNYKALGLRICYFRKKAKMTQAYLANMVEVERASISNIERGSTRVSLQTLIRIVNVLGISLDDILYDSMCICTHISNKEVIEILADCTEKEQKSIIKIMKSTKSILR